MPGLATWKDGPLASTRVLNDFTDTLIQEVTRENKIMWGRQRVSFWGLRQVEELWSAGKIGKETVEYLLGCSGLCGLYWGQRDCLTSWERAGNLWLGGLCPSGCVKWRDRAAQSYPSNRRWSPSLRKEGKLWVRAMENQGEGKTERPVSSDLARAWILPLPPTNSLEAMPRLASKGALRDQKKATMVLSKPHPLPKGTL